MSITSVPPPSPGLTRPVADPKLVSLVKPDLYVTQIILGQSRFRKSLPAAGMGRPTKTRLINLHRPALPTLKSD